MTRRSRSVVVVAVAAAVLLVPVLTVGAWFWWQLTPPTSPGDEVTVEVEEGWGNREIGDALDDTGVIGSSLAFQAYVRMTDAGPFHAGSYTLRSGLGVRDALRVLEAGPERAYEELALPPGMTLAEVSARVGALEGRDAAAFYDLATSGTIRSRYQPDGVHTLEGLLWPDTYFVDPDQTDEELARLLVDRFDEEAEALGLDAAAGLTPYQAVVAASLIETESHVSEERPVVSGVIRNRLADGMLLQVDASVLYARGGGDGALTVNDLALESPYNTYVSAGLPPTPIALVSAEALDAALRPADVPYRFYVLIDQNGEHAFAETYDEHLENVARARDAGLLD